MTLTRANYKKNENNWRFNITNYIKSLCHSHLNWTDKFKSINRELRRKSLKWTEFEWILEISWWSNLFFFIKIIEILQVAMNQQNVKRSLDAKYINCSSALIKMSLEGSEWGAETCCIGFISIRSNFMFLNLSKGNIVLEVSLDVYLGTVYVGTVVDDVIAYTGVKRHSSLSGDGNL